MRREKRVWIYAGLGVPRGTALVRKPDGGRGFDGRRVLLVGRDEAYGLSAPLARLAADSGVSFRVDFRRGTSAMDWAENQWLDHHLRNFRPTSVFFVADLSDSVAAKKVAAKVRLAGAPLLWLTPGFHGRRPWSVPARDLTVSGYAAWAGQAWAMLQ
jgi:hypothetical protein